MLWFHRCTLDAAFAFTLPCVCGKVVDGSGGSRATLFVFIVFMPEVGCQLKYVHSCGIVHVVLSSAGISSGEFALSTCLANKVSL